MVAVAGRMLTVAGRIRVVTVKQTEITKLFYRLVKRRSASLSHARSAPCLRVRGLGLGLGLVLGQTMFVLALVLKLVLVFNVSVCCHVLCHNLPFMTLALKDFLLQFQNTSSDMFVAALQLL